MLPADLLYNHLKQVHLTQVVHKLLMFQGTSQPSGGGGSGSGGGATPARKTQASAPKVRKSVSSRIHEAVKAIALCHNVTPVYESHGGVNGEAEFAEAEQDFSDDNRTYQASSPDEVRTREVVWDHSREKPSL